MKMVKSLLLVSAAGLVAASGAQAADLPVKAKPVEYVKVCSLYGAGFYYVPGTDICLKVGAYFRAEYAGELHGQVSKTADADDAHPRGRIDAVGAQGIVDGDAAAEQGGGIFAVQGFGDGKDEAHINTSLDTMAYASGARTYGTEYRSCLPNHCPMGTRVWLD